jgi:hypothetical protein
VGGQDGPADDGDRADTLPGGSVVVWPPSGRPAWFMKRAPCTKQAGDGARVSSLNVSAGAADAALSPGKRKLCKRIARRALKQDSGGVRLQALVKDSVRALQAAGEEDARHFKSQIRRFFKSSRKWAVRGGLVVAA